MAKSKKCFIVFFLVVIFSAWLPFSGGKVVGDGQNPRISAVKLSFFDKTAQAKIEADRNRKFGFRNGLILLRNALYDAFNFGRFHISLGRMILEGRRGTVFHRDYTSAHFCPDRKACMDTLEKNTASVARLKNRLSDYGIPLLFVLNPNKDDSLRKDWPVLWNKFYKKSRNKIDWYALYEEKLSSAGVPVLNLQRALMKHAADPDFKYYFPKGGSHFTLAGAGILVPELADFFNRHGGTNLSPPPKKRLAFSREPLHNERDLFLLMNLPFEREAEETFAYYVFEGGSGKTDLTWYGDSYGSRFRKVLVASSLVPEAGVAYHESKLLNRKEAYDAVEKNAPVVLAYTLMNLPLDRIREEAENFLAQLDAPDFSEGWHQREPGEKRWTSQKAVTRFLSDCKRDYVLKMRLENKMPKIGSFSASLNGQSLGDVTVHGKIGQTLEIPLPKALLKKGVNTVQFDIPGAVKARTMMMSADDRTRGLYLSKIEIRPVP